MLILPGMPLFYQHNIDAHGRLAIWKIEEQESFFKETAGGQIKIGHPYKRLQHLAGRYLLAFLQPDLPLSQIAIGDSGKPYLPDEGFHFSISHCGNYAAVIISRHRQVGIDIELATPRLNAIATRFLHPDENKFLQEWREFPQLYLQLLTLIWSAKEAVFKWYGKGKVSFSQQINLRGPIVARSAGEYEMDMVFRKDGEQHLQVHARIFEPLVMAWLVH